MHNRTNRNFEYRIMCLRICGNKNTFILFFLLFRFLEIFLYKTLEQTERLFQNLLNLTLAVGFVDIDEVNQFTEYLLILSHKLFDK